MSRSLWLLAVIIGSLGAAATGPSAAQQEGLTPPQRVSWQSAGDSFSSGEGVPGNQGACAQSPAAYGPRAADLLRAAGWQIPNQTFTACTGHLVEDLFNPRTLGGSSLWEWGRRQGGPERVDMLTMSFGGNDIGFADTLADCLTGKPDSWAEFIGFGLASSLTGCDTSEEDIRARIDALLDPPRRGCTGFRHPDSAEAYDTGIDGFECDLNLGGRRGSIIDFYYDIVTERLTPRGRLYVVGYPRLFADVNQWPGWVQISCEGVKRGDTERLGRLAEHLNNGLQQAVASANEALGSERVVFIDRLALHRDGLHELCGTNEDWLNGLFFSRGHGFEIRRESSFHPNAAGHEGVATHLVDRIGGTFPRSVELADADLAGLSGCRQGPCAVTGRVPVDHPRWGPLLVVSFGPQAGTTPMCADRMLIAVDAAGDVVWDSGVAGAGCPWYGFAPAGTGEYGSPVTSSVDASGRIFYDWNPGRYNGVSVLTVTDTGFDHHRTLPINDLGRFYSAEVDDADSDGTFEIRTAHNDCFESCADGTTSETLFAWSGRDFTPVAPTEPQFCGAEWLSATNGEEDIVEDITVVGVSCYEAYGLDGPQLVREIAAAHDPFSEVREFSAAGYRCTVRDEGFEEQQYRCEGRGVITFRRYARY